MTQKQLKVSVVIIKIGHTHTNTAKVLVKIFHSENYRDEVV